MSNIRNGKKNYQDDINALGNWCKHVFHEYCSSNLQLSVMRYIAVFDNSYALITV